jgi:hypothetical protein
MTSPDLPIRPYDREYPGKLGKLIANLSTLEFGLRVALYCMDTPREKRRPNDWRLASLNVGDQVEDCWLSSWSYLTGLVGAFNERQTRLGLKTIDSGIADLRNAMAHGVITSVDALDTPVCVKFGRGKDGIVRVEEKYVLTFEWIGEQTNRVYEAGRFVVGRVQELR